MKTENSIFAAFCECLDKAKDVTGVPITWTVLARNPQVMAHFEDCILVDKIYQQRRGFQNERYETKPDGRLAKIWEWIEEYRFQVSLFRYRAPEDTVDTVTAGEVASLLQAWLNSSDGAAEMRSRGLAPLFVHEVMNQCYKDDNGVYQYFPHFDVQVQTVQEKEFVAPHVTAADLGMRHVPLCPGESGGSVVYERIWEEGSGSSGSGSASD